MADHRTCGCDEARFLRAENLRLQGAIELVRATVATSAPIAKEPKRCQHYASELTCELPRGHEGCHRSGRVAF